MGNIEDKANRREAGSVRRWRFPTLFFKVNRMFNVD